MMTTLILTVQEHQYQTRFLNRIKPQNTENDFADKCALLSKSVSSSINDNETVPIVNDSQNVATNDQSNASKSQLLDILDDENVSIKLLKPIFEKQLIKHKNNLSKTCKKHVRAALEKLMRLEVEVSSNTSTAATKPPKKIPTNTTKAQKKTRKKRQKKEIELDNIITNTRRDRITRLPDRFAEYEVIEYNRSTRSMTTNNADYKMESEKSVQPIKIKRIQSKIFR